MKAISCLTVANPFYGRDPAKQVQKSADINSGSDKANADYSKNDSIHFDHILSLTHEK